MLFPILLIVIPAILLVAAARWAKTDEDDTLRKIVTSIVQLMCLMAMVIGVAWFANRAANGPPAKEPAVFQPAEPNRQAPFGGNTVTRPSGPASIQAAPASTTQAGPPDETQNGDQSGGPVSDQSAGQPPQPDASQSAPADSAPATQNQTDPAAGNPPGGDQSTGDGPPGSTASTGN